MKTDINLRIFWLNKKITVHRGWIQSGVISLVLIMSLLAAFSGSIKVLLLLLVALGGLAAVFVVLHYPNLGFILIFLGGMFVPFSGPGGVNASILSVILLMALWMMDMLVVRRRFEFVRSRAIRPAFYFVVISIFAFGMGQIPWFVFANQAPLDAQVGGFAIYFFLLATMIMTANLVQDLHWLKIIVWAFVALGTFYILGRVVNFSFIDRLYQRGVSGNSMFWMWLIGLPLSQAIFNNRLQMRTRVMLYAIVALSFYIALIRQSDWKSGWVPAAVVTVTLLGLRFRRFAWLLIPVLPLVIIYLAQDLISTDSYSWGTRVDAWMIVLKISSVSPIIGLGFANYYWYASLFPIRGYAISFNSHSQFVDIIAQTGLLGLFCFFWLCFEVARLSWKLMHSLPDGFAKGYAHGIFAGVLGSIMAAFLVDWLLPFAYNIGLNGVRASILPWIFFGGLISVEQLYLENRDTTKGWGDHKCTQES